MKIQQQHDRNHQQSPSTSQQFQQSQSQQSPFQSALEQELGQQHSSTPGQGRSGVYLRTGHAYGSSSGSPIGSQTGSTGTSAGAGAYEEIRVDVDGMAPTMTVSGTIWRLTTGAQNWIATVSRQADGSYSGPIGYREGNPLLRPYSSLSVQLTGRFPLEQPRAVVAFQRPDGPDKVLGYSYARPFFSELEIEVDRTADTSAATEIQPQQQSDHQQPSPKPTQKTPQPRSESRSEARSESRSELHDESALDLTRAFQRQGIKVLHTGSDEPIDIGAASAQPSWTDIELHDAAQRHAAMRHQTQQQRSQQQKHQQQTGTKSGSAAQTYPVQHQHPGSHLDESPQQHIWTLFTKRHEYGPGITGAVLDGIGRRQQPIQACVVFNDSSLADIQTGEGDAEAQQQRIRFVSAVREIGHALGLADSWDKSRPMSWVPMADEPEARSFMNDPTRVAGGPKAFFADFPYLFSEEELRFLRHMPGHPEQQTAIPWFEHQSYEQVRRAVQMTGSGLRLKIRVGRPAGPDGTVRFGMLEPVIGQISLKNQSHAPVVVDHNLLKDDDLSIVVMRKGSGEARMLRPIVRHSRQSQPFVLQPGESLQQQVMLSAGVGGWQITEPGTYRVYAALRCSSGVGASGMAGQVLAQPLTVQVDRPVSREQEKLADEVCSEQVGRVLALGGSRVLDEANEVLRRVVQQIPKEPLARHAAAALAYAACVPGKVLEGTGEKQHLIVPPTDPQTARPMIDAAYGDLDAAFETFGPVRLSRDVLRIGEALSGQGEQKRSAEMADKLARCLQQHEVKPQAVERVRQTQQRFSGTSGSKQQSGQQPKK